MLYLHVVGFFFLSEFRCRILHFCIVFLKLFKGGFSNLVTSPKALTYLKTKQNPGLANTSFSILFLLFQTKPHCSHKQGRLGHFSGKRLQMGAWGASGSAGHLEWVLHSLLPVALKGTLLLLHFSQETWKGRSRPLAPIKIPEMGKVCSSIFAELQ